MLKSKITRNEDDLLDYLIELLDLRNDSHLCEYLEIHPPIISKIRHRHQHIGAALILIIHEMTGMAIKEIKSYLTFGPYARIM